MQIDQDLKYKITLTQTFNIGPSKAKRLYKVFGNAEAIFKASIVELMETQIISLKLAQQLKNTNDFTFAEEEISFIQRYNIQAIAYGTPQYPTRLIPYENAPFLLYFKGSANLNERKIVALVGTRKPSEYGKEQCERLIEELKDYQPLILSGLAYGIDTCAHKKALLNALDTVGVIAHGLDRIYPHANRKLAEQMMTQGGLLTEFTSRTRPIPANFPARNRIIAALADAVVVVETAETGGSMITANLANEYQKDVFAVPGPLHSNTSMGCNQLIKTHKASLITKAEDIAYLLRWEKQRNTVQKQLFVQLSTEEKAIMNQLLGHKNIHINQLIHNTKMSTSRLSSYLIELELKGLIKALAGKYYRIS